MAIINLLLAFAFASPHYQESWISPAGLFPANHGSTLVELPDKKLLACWYAGSREGGKDVQIYCSSKDLHSTTWPMPEVAVKEDEKIGLIKNKTLGNPSLFLDPENTLWLFYTSIQVGGWAGGKVDYKTSKDFGKTWSKGKRLVGSFGNLTRTKPILLSSNPIKIMLPLYHEFTSKNGYTCTLELSNAEIKSEVCNEIPGKKHIQPSLVKIKDQIFAYLRNNDKNGVLVSQFNSQNQEWSQPVLTNLPNPDSSVDAVDYQDQVLIVFNNHNDNRSPLSLAISKDGLNFKNIWDFEIYGHNIEYSYPSIIFTSSGGFQLSYSFEKRNAIKNIEFTKEWLDNLLKK